MAILNLLNIHAGQNEINNSFQLGAKKNNNTSLLRKFCNKLEEEQGLKNKKKLRSGMYIKENHSCRNQNRFCPNEQRTRSTLWRIVFFNRKKIEVIGQKAYSDRKKAKQNQLFRLNGTE